ncbi:methionine--tRNA ligase [candidate division TA06 bacterium]|uniref:Methionine--tRNA ligase n=1 Tax=candidate division TA06 bacterium TaxID=2250710 RepID=A0A933IC27_UNCT6|nr:methionine--tRNA ligase [candidate division TA06 bacterium]
MSRFYITTAIPYVNAKPHIGFALEIVQTDALARYYRLFGRDVRFLTGSDENSLKNVQTAEKEGISTEILVKRNAKFFADMHDYLSLSNDDFIRTSSEQRHRKGVEKLWQACLDNGDIYKKRYQGLYCVGCEGFYPRDELVDGKCPEHDTVPEKIEEENYFFRLSKYQKQLEEILESDKYQIIPKTRKNEVLSFVKSGLEDFSISRSKERAKSWGIPVPGDPSQVVYVWFDALANYINALEYAADGQLYRDYWTDCPERVHVIGKGIIRFHAVYWPAMLLSAKVPLPHKLLVHGYIICEGRRMSKSLGNVIDPEAIASRYGTDQLRYFLLSEISTTGDGDFSYARLEQRVNSDLANDYGNLASRVFKMVETYCGGAIPEAGKLGSSDGEFKLKALELGVKVKSQVEQFDLNDAIVSVMEVIKLTNRYAEANAPWKLFKDGNQERIDTVLYNAAEALRIASILLSPVMPGKCRELLSRLGVEEKNITLARASGWGLLKAGQKVSAGEPLFPRIDTKTKDEGSPATKLRASKRITEETNKVENEKTKDEGRKQITEETNKVESEKTKDEGRKQMIEETKTPENTKQETVNAQPVSEELIDIDYFKKIKLRTAEIVAAEKVPNADKLLRLQVKLGEETRQVLAGIAQWYAPESLVGQQVIIVANLKPAKIRGLESHGMLLAAQDKDGVVILIPQRKVETGGEVR